MKYSLYFIPEVEEDVIGGYVWYEAKTPGLGEEFSGCFMPALLKFPGIHYFIQKYIGCFVVGCFGDFLMPFIS